MFLTKYRDFKSYKRFSRYDRGNDFYERGNRDRGYDDRRRDDKGAPDSRWNRLESPGADSRNSRDSPDSSGNRFLLIFEFLKNLIFFYFCIIK